METKEGEWRETDVHLYTYTDGSGHLTLNFCQSSKTVSIQGNGKNTEKVQEKLDNLLQTMKPALVGSENKPAHEQPALAPEEAPVKRKKRNRSNKEPSSSESADPKPYQVYW